MDIVALGYLGITSKRPDDWTGYATSLLGMQLVDRGGATRAFRMDNRKQRLVVTDGDDGLGFMGWEAADAGALDRLASRLDNAGIRVELAPQSLADERFVDRLIRFQDPEGNVNEVFSGQHIDMDRFVPGRPISGFKTGAMGMGHAVLKVIDADRQMQFYRDLLGFRLSDYSSKPYPLYFFHVNGRHHSFAMVGLGTRGFHHFMVEYESLDDMGQGYDLAQTQEGRIAYTLGRHTNDYMTSFYANAPSGFFVEYGWGAREVDPATWQPHETFDGPSYWGHERVHLPEGAETRERMREMRLDAARRGLRAPDPVGNCAWLDAVIRQE